MKILSVLLAFVIGLVVGYFIFHNNDSNSRIMYGESGLPKNCRAVIKNDIDGFRAGKLGFRSEEIIDHIDKNCGEFGYSWDIKK